MKHWVKFGELEKKDKIFRVVNLVVCASIFLTCLSYLIYLLVAGDPYERIFSSSLVMVISLVPLAFELIFRRRLNPVIFLLFEIYLAIAGLFGSVFRGYDLIWWFDKPVHILMGYVFAMLGIFVLGRVIDYKKLNVFTVVLFCFCFSLAIELIWELFEWFADNFLGQHAQGAPAINNVPLVTNTMEDLLCNFSGALVFSLHFIIGKLSKVSLGIKSIEEALTNKIVYKRKIEENSAKTEKEETPKSVEPLPAVEKENSQSTRSQQPPKKAQPLLKEKQASPKVDKQRATQTGKKKTQKKSNK